MSPNGSVENKSQSLGKVTFSTALYLKQNLSPPTQQPKPPIIQGMGLDQHGPASGLGVRSAHRTFSPQHCLCQEGWLVESL